MIASVSIVFRLANFGVCIGFVVYLYYRYAKEYITHAMEHDKRIVDGLQKERDAVVRIADEYKDVVTQRQKQRMQMQGTIMEWQKIVSHEKVHRLLEKKNREIALKHKVVRQAELLRMSAITYAVLPDAVARARTELEREFSHEKAGADFVQRIIAHLQESKS